MRRALVGLPESDLKTLDAISKVQHVSRAELIRQAVSLYLAQFTPIAEAGSAFGLWQSRRVDGLAYQTQLRDEW
jgi:metal-responsive CopG/Arc/MetJ family transcriptional regulator